MRRIALIGLIKIELPTATIRLTDGGYIEFGGETYASKDPVFGALASLDGLNEGAGQEVPALDMALMPPSSSAPADLSQPGFQRSRVRLWLGEYDQGTGTLIGAPNLLFDGQIDQTTLTVGADQRELAMTIVASAERLFERNRGNNLSPSFHKLLWPGETGEDNATGLSRQIAWGVEAPQTTTTTYYQGGIRGLTYGY